MKADLIALLRDMRFTEYEAKAYLALLEKSPMTGYAVALQSGVPRSKIYSVLGSLTNRGDILASRDEVPLYTPLGPAELVAERKRKADLLFDAAESSLKKYANAEQQREIIWNIVGRDAILGRVRESIGRAERRILMELWSDDAEELRDGLAEAAARGVEVQIVAYGDIGFEFAEVYRHDLSDAITEEYEGRWIILSVDDSEVVAGIVSMNEDSRAAQTVHPGLVMPITEVIVHDLYIMEILKRFRPELEEQFGRDLVELRRRFSIAPEEGRKNYLRLRNAKNKTAPEKSGAKKTPKRRGRAE